MVESAVLLVDEVLPEQPVCQWVLSFPDPLRFLCASRPEIMGQVLGIVYRTITTRLIKKAGFTKKSARTGVVTLIQRFGSALNLNIRFHIMFLVGVCANHSDGSTGFRWVSAIAPALPYYTPSLALKVPTSQELTQLAHIIAHRVGRFLERYSLL